MNALEHLKDLRTQYEVKWSKLHSHICAWKLPMTEDEEYALDHYRAMVDALNAMISDLEWGIIK
jgi:hypothetical protein